MACLFHLAGVRINDAINCIVVGTIVEDVMHIGTDTVHERKQRSPLSYRPTWVPRLR